MTAEALVAPPGQVIHPRTGELLDVKGADTRDLGVVLDEIAEMKRGVDSARRTVSDELLERMDRDAKWTIHLPGIDVVGESPEQYEWDGEELANVLVKLVAGGLIGRDAATAACEEVRTFKPRTRGIQALLKLGGEVADALLAVRRERTRPRRVSVKRP